MLSTAGTVVTSSSQHQSEGTVSLSDLRVPMEGASPSEARDRVVQAVRDCVISSTATLDALADIVLTYRFAAEIYLQRRISQSHGGFLPNVLICGGSGNGKTICAKLIAAASGIDYALITGNDIRAHGPNGDKELRKVIEACWLKTTQEKKQYMLIIDDVDAIARDNRGQGRQGNTQQNAAPSCLHQLLFAFKGSSSSLCLVATSSVPPNSLNQALVDR